MEGVKVIVRVPDVFGVTWRVAILTPGKNVMVFGEKMNEPEGTKVNETSETAERVIVTVTVVPCSVRIIGLDTEIVF